MGRLHVLKYSAVMKDVNKVDAVSVATPPSSNFEIVRDFLNKNIYVIVEKPISQNTCQNDKLIRVSKNKKFVLQVGHIEQLNSALISIKNKIYDILFFESNRLTTFKKRNFEISIIFDLMIHDLEILLSFLDKRIKSIEAKGIKIFSENTDIAKVNLLFSNGIIANLTASRIEANNIYEELNFYKINPFFQLI